MSLFDRGSSAIPPQRRRWLPSGPPVGAPAGAFDGAGDLAGSGAGPGVGAITGSSAFAGDGALLVAGSTAFTGAGALAGVSNAAFPLAVHSSGRYLVRADGTPFLLCADSTWSLFVDIPLNGVATYFATLVAQGFNALMGNAIEHHFSTVKPPKERGGLLPFTQRMDGATYTGSPNGTTAAAGTQGQFGSDNYGSPSTQSPDPTFINNAYWVVVEQILDAALAHNLLIFIWPSYLGFHAGDEGWMGEMVVWNSVIGAGGFTGESFADPTKSKMFNYGAWLAARWKNYPNIVWMAGGDFGSGALQMSAPQRAAELSFVQGMKSVANQQSVLWGGHWERPCISDDTTLTGVTWDINFCYSDEAVAELCRRGYNTAAKPAVLGEYNYEDGLFGGTAPWRKYLYWGFLGGIAGGFYGHEQLWRFDDGTPGTDWTTLLATTARNDAVRQFALWRSLPWHRLKPSGLGGMSSLITAGGGTASPQSTNYVAAAATSEGDLLLAYIPPAHTGSITVAMTAMAATCRARWFDPSNSAFTAIGMIANTGTHAFTPPGTNNAGDTDFLLVLDVPVGSIDGAGDMAGTAQALASAPGALTGSGAFVGAGAATAATVGALSGSGSIAGFGASGGQGVGDFSASGAIGAVGAARASASTPLSGTGALAGAAQALAASAGAMSGAGALVGTAQAVGSAVGNMSAAGAIAGFGSGPAPVVGSFSASGTMAGAGASSSAGSATGSFTGSGTIAAGGQSVAAGVGAPAGTGSITGTGASLAPSAASLSASGALSGASPTAVGLLTGSGDMAGASVTEHGGAGYFSGAGGIFGVSPFAVTHLRCSLQRSDRLFALLQIQGAILLDLIGPITIDQGDDIDLVITLTDDAGARVNLSGFQMELQVKPNRGDPDPPTISKSIAAGTIVPLDQTSPDTRGQATISISSIETNITPRLYWLDIVTINPVGKRGHPMPAREFTIAGVVNPP